MDAPRTNAEDGVDEDEDMNHGFHNPIDKDQAEVVPVIASPSAVVPLSVEKTHVGPDYSRNHRYRRNQLILVTVISLAVVLSLVETIIIAASDGWGHESFARTVTIRYCFLVLLSCRSSGGKNGSLGAAGTYPGGEVAACLQMPR